MLQPDIVISAFSRLGDELLRAADSLGDHSRAGSGSPDGPDPWDDLLRRVYEQNGWYTREQVLYAFRQWSGLLAAPRLRAWLQRYPAPAGEPKTVALVLAGNIPLVGFHDILCVLGSGNNVLAKCPSNDRLLIPFLASRLEEAEPSLSGRIRFTEAKLSGFDAVIATGSNNTSRYFEYYFAGRPHLIRKNRNSVAVLTGDESEAELQGLAEDVFRYFGMGCRSVSKLFVPAGYEFGPLFRAFYRFAPLIHHQKYANNYDYNKAVYLMSGAEMLDNGFLLLKHDTGMGSPIGTLFFEPYDAPADLFRRLDREAGELQCVVGPAGVPGAIPFGTSQQPGLTDYADGVDTVDFLLRNLPN